MRLKGLLAGLLVVSYAFALVMSTGHLSEWYRLTLGNLPGWFAVGLAAALEVSAFLLSLLSNSYLKGSKWASWGAVVALGLVWVGNYFSMRRAGEGVPEVEIFLSSLFVPVSTYVVAKVLGELQGNGEPAEAKREKKLAREVHLGFEDHREAHLEPGSLKEAHLEYGGSKEEGSALLVPLSAQGGNGAVKEGWRQRYLVLLETPKSAREIMEALGLAKPTVYKQLKRLEREGLVRNTGGRWVRVENHAG